MTQVILIELDQNAEAATNAELPPFTIRTLGEAHTFVHTLRIFTKDPAVRQQAEAVELVLHKMLTHYDSGAPIEFGDLLERADGIYDRAMRACDEDHIKALKYMASQDPYEGEEPFGVERNKLTNREHYVSLESVKIACKAIVGADDPITCARAILVSCLNGLHQVTTDGEHPNELARGRTLNRFEADCLHMQNVTPDELADGEARLRAAEIL